MFGYVRPMKGELKVRDYEMFQAAYCGLCRTMKRRYGSFSTAFLNYDLTFLTVLLLGLRGETGYVDKRCAASPFKKKKMCAPSSALDDCAGYAVMLTCGKLRDDAADSGIFRSILSRCALILLRRAEKRADSSLPGFRSLTAECMAALSAREADGCPVMDEMADLFARILEDTARCQAGEEAKPLKELLYHVGRWIYIVDAADDLREDLEAGRYNCLARRFSLGGNDIPEEVSDYVRTTLKLSSERALSLAGELELGNYTQLVENILSLGLPFVADRVLDGTWRVRRK